MAKFVKVAGLVLPALSASFLPQCMMRIPLRHLLPASVRRCNMSSFSPAPLLGTTLPLRYVSSGSIQDPHSPDSTKADTLLHVKMSTIAPEDREDIFRLLRKVAELDDANRALACVQMGRLHKEAKEWMDAEKCFRAAISADSLFPDGHFELASLFLSLSSSLGEAESSFKNTVELDPHHAEAHVGLGVLLIVGRNKLAEAEKWLRKGVELEPHNATALTYLGVIQERHWCNFREAASLYKRALREDENVKLLVDLGRLLMTHLEDSEGAETCFRRALELDPRAELAMVNLSWVLETSKGELDEAEALLRQAIAINPRLSNAYCRLGTLKLQYEDWEAAEENLRKALDLSNGTDVHAHVNMAIIYQQRYGQTKMAREHFDAAVRYNPSMRTYEMAIFQTGGDPFTRGN